MDRLDSLLQRLTAFVEAAEPDEAEDGMPDADEAEVVRGFQTTVNKAPGGDAHSHRAYVDEKGDGSTSRVDGHVHRISNGVVKATNGHTHDLIKPEARKTRGRTAGSNKPGSEKAKRKKKAVGVPSALPDAAPPMLQQEPEDENKKDGNKKEASPFEHLDHDPRWLNEEYGFVGKPHERVGWTSLRMAHDKYAVLKSILEDGDSLLDVGCGNGLLYDWILKKQPYSIAYFGIDESENFLREFVERHPTVAPRLRCANALTISEEDLPRDFFDVSVAIGVTADFGEGDEQYRRLRRLVEFMTSHSDVVVIEFWDKFSFKVEDRAGVPPSVWRPRKVLEVFGEADFDVQLVRPLSKDDFAVIAIRNSMRV